MSSIFAALKAAVSGLSAQSSAIGNISDNLANSQTIGFKDIDTKFESLVTESNANTNSPGGVSSAPYYMNSTQGDISSASVDTYLAISGSGYYAVKQAIVAADGTSTFAASTYYTRQGDFTLDAKGYLVNGSGYYLQGWAVDQNGVVDTSKVKTIQISDLLDNPVATSTVDYAANLPANAATGYTSASSTIIVYDSLGAEHDLNLSWEKAGTNQWTLSVACADASYTGTYTFDFHNASTGTAGTLASITDSSGTAMTSAAIGLNLTFAGAGAQSLSLDFGSFGSSTGLTQFSDTSSTPSVSVSSLEQNGIPRGSFKSLSVDDNGYLSINYDNGTSRTVYQIPIVQFFAENQLKRLSGSAYSATETSGTPRYTAAGTNGAGTISSNALESSNVDIATEFTKLIQAQRVYSANAKTITTADNMLQEVISIIR